MSIVGIHLDLKYTMPRKGYLLEWVKRLPELGINAILLEYEDKFPFEKYPFIRAEGHFTPDELREFLAAARQSGVQVIPLVQTLSHLEFALAHDELADLREGPDIPTQICPSKPEAVSFVKDLLSEVLAYHDEDEIFHIGADETWFLGTCPTCAGRMDGDKTRLWAEHTFEMCRFVMDRGKRPMVWDDVFWDNAEGVTALPRETMLVSWHYSLKRAARDKFPWKNVQVYQSLGYEVVGAPCLNWGVLVPDLQRVLNTVAWAQIARQAPCSGLINTAWACFHVPLAAHWLQVAATGALMAGSCEELDVHWEQSFLDREFGVTINGLAESLRALGTMWEVAVEGLGRPITPVVYGYMDAVLHFEGGQDERRRRGVYPLDWGEVDFRALYRRKLELLEASSDRTGILAKLDELLGLFGGAREVLNRLEDAARSRTAEAKLLALFADMKWLHTRVLSHMLREDGDVTELQKELVSQRDKLVERLSPFLEPVSVERMVRIWCDPAHAALVTKYRELDE